MIVEIDLGFEFKGGRVVLEGFNGGRRGAELRRSTVATPPRFEAATLRIAGSWAVERWRWIDNGVGGMGRC